MGGVVPPAFDPASDAQRARQYYDVYQVLHAARTWAGARADLEVMETGNCHANVTRLRTADRGQIASGWALATDGLWREHSWLVRRPGTPDEALLETTEQWLQGRDNAHGRDKGDGAMTSVRAVFLDALEQFLAFVDRPPVATAWEAGSALPDYTTGALVGHVLSATSALERYLDAPPPTAPPVPRGAYYAGVAKPGAAPELHAGIRQRGAAQAAGGHPAAMAAFRALRGRLVDRLAAEGEDRALVVAYGLPMRLDDYLETRIVELVVHQDDLAVGLGVNAGLAPAAVAVASDHLLEACRERHGGLEVLRALTRPGRTAPETLCVF